MTVSVPLSAVPSCKAEVGLRFGYTVGDLDRLASIAATKHRWHLWLGFAERLEIAWSAIAEHLYAVDAVPSTSDLMRAAWSAIRRHGEDEWHTHGVSRTDVLAGAGIMPNFARFWASLPRSSPEDLVVDWLALAQIWAALPEPYKRLLVAYAVHEDYGAAAESVGMKRSTFITTLSRARRSFLALWHEGEKPSGFWGKTGPKPVGSTNTAMRSLAQRRRRRKRAQGDGQ